MEKKQHGGANRKQGRHENKPEDKSTTLAFRVLKSDKTHIKETFKLLTVKERTEMFLKMCEIVRALSNCT